MNKENVIHTHIMEYYSVIKRRKLLFATPWMDLECITLSEMSQRKTKTERKTNTVCFHFYVEPKIKQNS